MQITLRNAATATECEHSQTHVSPSHPTPVISVVTASFFTSQMKKNGKLARPQSRQVSRRASLMCGSDPDLRFKTGYGCSANYFPFIIRIEEILIFSLINNNMRAHYYVCYCCHCLSNLLFFRSRAKLLMFRAGFPRSFPVVHPLRKRTHAIFYYYFIKNNFFIFFFLYVDQLK